MTRPAESPGRLLERIGDDAPRGMTVQDRTRLIGRLRRFSARRAEKPQGFASHGDAKPWAPGLCLPNPRRFAAPPLPKGAWLRRSWPPSVVAILFARRHPL